MTRKRNRSSNDVSSSESSASSNESSSSSSSSESMSDDDKKPIDSRKKNVNANKPAAKMMPSDSSSSSDDSDDDEWNAKPKANKSKVKRNTNNKTAVKKQPTTKTVKKKMRTAATNSSDNSDDNDENNNNHQSNVNNNYDNEKEEGEVDFSDDDDDDDNEEFNDGFDENLLGDEEDQKKLAQMTEKEREQELFNRSEKREVLRTRFEIERKLRLAKKQEMKKKSNNNNANNNNNDKQNDSKNLDSLFTESASRSVERRRNMEDKRKVKDAMKGLKAEREKKKEKLKQKLKATDIYSDSSDSDDSNVDLRVIKKDRKKSSSSDDYSSSLSISDDSDVDTREKSNKRDNDWDNERSGDHDENIEQFDFTIEHLNSIRLSRFKMEKWCHAPFFRDTVMNAFVRIGVGNSSSLTQYLVGQIVDVVETPKIYTLGQTRTNKGIKLKHANDPERIFRLEYVSNSEFNETEFQHWYSKMIADKCDFPTKDLVERKKSDIQRAINYNYSNEDIEMIVAEKERFKNKPTNFAMKKTQLIKDKEFAEMNGDHEKAIEISKEIDRLEEESKKLEKKRTQSIASISFINERNRMRNIQEAERAIAEAAKEAQNQKDDPFTRRKCAPTMIHVFNKNKQSQSNTDSSNTKNNNEQSSYQQQAVKNSETKENSDSNDFVNNNKNGQNTKSNNNNNTNPDNTDMFSVHNFEIKIDFETLDSGLVGGNNSNDNDMSTTSSTAATNTSSLLFTGLSSSNNAKTNGLSSMMMRSNHHTHHRNLTLSNSSGTNRRMLNLDEYKKKKGLI